MAAGFMHPFGDLREDIAEGIQCAGAPLGEARKCDDTGVDRTDRPVPVKGIDLRKKIGWPGLSVKKFLASLFKK